MYVHRHFIYYLFMIVTSYHRINKADKPVKNKEQKSPPTALSTSRDKKATGAGPLAIVAMAMCTLLCREWNPSGASRPLSGPSSPQRGSDEAPGSLRQTPGARRRGSTAGEKVSHQTTDTFHHGWKIKCVCGWGGVCACVCVWVGGGGAGG